MTPVTKRILEAHKRDIEKINNQRRTWLYASSIVVVGLLILMFGWDWINNFHSQPLWWFIVSLMLVVSINWWYWTMRVIRILLNYNTAAYDLLGSIITDVQSAREDIKQLANQSLDSKK